MSLPVTYIFRELKSPADLRASFALRYEVYSRTPGLCCLDSLESGSRLDVDGFDRYSRHFGVFAHSAAQTNLLGCLRVSGLRLSPHVAAIREAVAGSQTAVVHLDRQREGLLPATAYSVERRRFASAVLEIDARAEDVVEAGRLVMLPAVRCPGSAGVLRLARGVVAAVTAQFFFATGVPNALVNCHLHHRRFYRPFGFCELEGGAAHVEPALDGLDIVSLHGRPEWLFPKTRALCQRLADELVTTGRAVLATTACRSESAPQDVAA